MCLVVFPILLIDDCIHSSMPPADQAFETCWSEERSKMLDEDLNTMGSEKRAHLGSASVEI